MGTRSLISVIQKEQPVVAQYSQWDGYPEGQGVTILDFLRKYNKSKRLFKNQLKKVRFMSDEDRAKSQKFLESIGSKDGWLTMEQAEKYKREYPYQSRDIGGDILRMIMESTDEEILLVNSFSFAADSLFCEYAYIIDLDKNTFEVYRGFNQSDLDQNERFANMPKSADDRDGYKPVSLLHSFDLKKLPSNKDFLNILEPEEVEE